MRIAFAGPSLWVVVLFAVFALAFMYFKLAWSPTSLFHRTAHAAAAGAHTRANRFTPSWVTGTQDALTSVGVFGDSDGDADSVMTATMDGPHKSGGSGGLTAVTATAMARAASDHGDGDERDSTGGGALHAAGAFGTSAHASSKVAA